MDSNRVTMKQIAEKAGTSIGTVDRALSNRKGINQETKELVLKVAQELGYKRNNIASALSRRKKINIAIIYAQSPTGFYNYIDAGVDKAANEFKDYGVIVHKFKTDLLNPTQQVNLLKSIDHFQYDAIAINCAGNPTADYINKWSEDIPVITFNSDSPESKRLFFVGNNARLSGNIAGELLGNYLNGTGKVAVIGNFINTNTFIERFGGFSETISQKFPDIQVQLWAECCSQWEIAYKTTIDMLEKNSDISGMYSIGYSSTIGICEALKTLNKSSIKMIGYDVSTDVIEAVNQGFCDVTIYQDPMSQSYQAIRLLFKFLTDNWRPKKQQLYIDTKILLSSNITNYSEDYLKDNPFD